MPESMRSQPRLVVDDSPVMVLDEVVQPELVAAFDPPASPVADAFDRHVEVLPWSARGARLADRLDRAGHTEDQVFGELATAITVAQAAERRLTAPVRQRLAWPDLAGVLTADSWLAAYAGLGPAGWLLDLAGGLAPAALLRCCLAARPATKATLWLSSTRYPPPLALRGRPVHAPVTAGSARSLLRLSEYPKPGEETPQQP